MFSRLFFGILGILLAFGLIKYRKAIGEFTGSWGWAERYFGAGGTYTGIVLIGLVTVIFSIMYMTGSLQGVLAGTVGRIF